MQSREVRAMPAPSSRAGAIVIGGDYRSLGVVRSLGRHGIPVWVLIDTHLVAATSRYSCRNLPWPQLDEGHQLEYLLALAERYDLDQWSIYPSGDEAVALLARHHDRLSERYLLTTPSWDVIRWFYDKRQTYQLAAEVGVDYPWTRYPRNREETAALDCEFPVILKPALKESMNPFTAAKAWRVNDRAALLARYDEARRLVDPELIMVQELIPGGGDGQVAYASLCLDGRPLASAVTGNNRQWPLDFGRASSYAETIEHEEVEMAAQRLLAAVRYTGLAQIQFKFDFRDGRYKLLDINPRVWGTHTLCRHAGIDFPYLLWRLLHGETVEKVRATPGVRWVRMATDIPAVLRQLRAGQLSLGAYLHSLRGPLGFAIFASDDLLPALLDVPLAFYSPLRRRYFQRDR